MNKRLNIVIFDKLVRLNYSHATILFTKVTKLSSTLKRVCGNSSDMDTDSTESSDDTDSNV